jgi:predicted GNAT family acetyltransferase
MAFPEIAFCERTDGVNWLELKAALAADRFDNGRTPEELRQSFENSRHCIFAMLEGGVIGAARAISDGVCNACIVDVWTHSRFRGRGIATALVHRLLSRLEGQHVSLFTDAAAGLYARLGFEPQMGGMSLVVGTWLRRAGNSPASPS